MAAECALDNTNFNRDILNDPETNDWLGKDSFSKLGTSRAAEYALTPDTRAHNQAVSDQTALPILARQTAIVQPANPGAFSASQSGVMPTHPMQLSAVGRSNRITQTAAAALEADSSEALSAANHMSSHGLVTAIPVSSSRQPLPTAEEVPEAADTRLLLVIIALVIIVVAAVLLGGFLPIPSSTADGSNSSKILAPTTAPSNSEQFVLSHLPESTIQELRDPDSPQSLAYEWLLLDPSLADYPAWRIQQRLALATLDYAMDGPRWHYNDFWLDYQVHECDWFSSYSSWSYTSYQVTSQEIRSNILEEY